MWYKLESTSTRKELQRSENLQHMEKWTANTGMMQSPKYANIKNQLTEKRCKHLDQHVITIPNYADILKYCQTMNLTMKS